MSGPERWLPWADAWSEALYGGSGFYRSAPGPAGSFATAAQGIPMAGEVLAGALLRWIRHEGLSGFVDMGCGRGELVTLVQGMAPDLTCTGVDVVTRPAALPEPVSWVQGEGGARVPDLGSALPGGTVDGDRSSLVFANEWLDVVPCTVAEVDRHELIRVVLVDPTSGEEGLGDPVDPADLSWCEAYWPSSGLRAGARVEVGRARDQAWRSLVDEAARLGGGVVVAADYGHTSAARPAAGTLTAYRQGRQVRPVPDGSCDLTAHVTMDSLGAEELTDQRSMLRQLGVRGDVPDHVLASRDPAAYLRGLSRSSAEAALIARGGLGGFLWAVTRLGPAS